jgi:1-acyl-sn-glycerol-3-phosphate acyltransferase
MFEAAIKDHRTQILIQKDRAVKTYSGRISRDNRIKEFFCRIFYFGIAIPILYLVNTCVFGLKIKNRKAARKVRNTGAVTICNHIHEMDSTICAVGLAEKKLIYVSKPVNFDLNVAGMFVDILGSVPTPSSPKELQSFVYILSKQLRQGHLVHFYPEGELIRYERNLHDFRRGAFYLAIDAQVPVLPMRIICRKPDGLLRFFKKKPCFTLVMGEPIYPNHLMLKKEAAEDIQKRAEYAMQNLAI